MALRGLVRWTIFAIYIGLFFVFPLGVLWDLAGLVIGLILTASFLFLLAWRGCDRIARRLNARLLTVAEAPYPHAILQEHCRRLLIPVPELRVIETPAINCAVFGFSRQRMCLALTRGMLDALARNELSALMGRELTYLWCGDAVGDSWLAQFLATLDSLVTPVSGNPSHPGRRFYPFKLFLRQGLVYPLVLIPVYLLSGRREPSELDLKSVRLTRKPEALAEALRLLEAYHLRIPLIAPFSVRHLFLLPPSTQDPLARVFFGNERLQSRIRAVEALSQLVTPT